MTAATTPPLAPPVTARTHAGSPLFALAEAALRAQRPDVILTQAVCDVCALREEEAPAVAARMSPAPRVVTLGARTVEGILDDCLAVAQALDMPEEGEELVAGLRSRIGAVHRRLKAAQAPRPTVLVLEWTDPLYSAGHWVPDMVRRAGGQEVIGRSGELSRRIGDEALRSVDPEMIVVAPCGADLVEARHAVEPLAVTFSKPCWVLDANRLTSTPAPGVVRGIEVLARVLHPAIFGPPDPRDAVPLRAGS